MLTYGWTLDQALDLTMAQTNLLFKQMNKCPSPLVALGAMLGGKDAKDKPLDKLAASGAVVTAPVGRKFLAALGVEQEEAGG